MKTAVQAIGTRETEHCWWAPWLRHSAALACPHCRDVSGRDRTAAELSGSWRLEPTGSTTQIAQDRKSVV